MKFKNIILNQREQFIFDIINILDHAIDKKKYKNNIFLSIKNWLITLTPINDNLSIEYTIYFDDNAKYILSKINTQTKFTRDWIFNYDKSYEFVDKLLELLDEDYKNLIN